jgi:uncharacterized short protein YbdD (DUF466 family)
MPAVIERIAHVIRRVIGVPDYDAYLAHCAVRHPDEIPLTRDAFLRDTLVRKHTQPGNRCC